MKMLDRYGQPIGSDYRPKTRGIGGIRASDYDQAYSKATLQPEYLIPERSETRTFISQKQPRTMLPSDKARNENFEAFRNAKSSLNLI